MCSVTSTMNESQELNGIYYTLLTILHVLCNSSSRLILAISAILNSFRQMVLSYKEKKRQTNSPVWDRKVDFLPSWWRVSHLDVHLHMVKHIFLLRQEISFKLRSSDLVEWEADGWTPRWFVSAHSLLPIKQQCSLQYGDRFPYLQGETCCLPPSHVTYRRTRSIAIMCLKQPLGWVILRFRIFN